MEVKQRRTFRCGRCRFIWVQYMTEGEPDPERCPKCNSSEWNGLKRPTSNSKPTPER